MYLITDVWKLANQFMDNPRYVSIDENAIDMVAGSVARHHEQEHFGIGALWGYPKCIDSSHPRAFYELFLYEIIANSVNYCYWYGKHDIRPNGSDSPKMCRLLDDSFGVLTKLKELSSYSRQHELEIIIDQFTGNLTEERFPLLDHRIRHLNEVAIRRDLTSHIDNCIRANCFSVESWLEYLVMAFPGYGKDLFLKRAFLFIIQMYRRLGLFKDEIHKIPVPADYQIPKMLRMLGCIKYNYPLDSMVNDGRLIPEGSLLECEIRAATIVVCKKIADLAGCSCADVDTYLFANRKTCRDPFHLTVTTNY